MAALMHALHTFSEWNDIFWKEQRFKVLDPDGFDRTIPDFHSKLYSREEFERRASSSTCQYMPQWGEQRFDSTSKPTNPKDIVGSSKVPLHLVSPALEVFASIGLLNGLLKYGRANYREAGIRASIYYDALGRHMKAWFEGEWEDPDDGVPHLCAAAACLNIIIDAVMQDKLVDDRNYDGKAFRRSIEVMTPYVGHLKELHADKHPDHHWTIADNAPPREATVEDIESLLEVQHVWRKV